MNKLYVAMTDEFMSGWGPAEGKINKYVIECDNQQQAKQIEAAALKRSEMQYIIICAERPVYDPEKYLMSEKHYNDLGTIWTEGKYRTAEEED